MERSPATAQQSFIQDFSEDEQTDHGEDILPECTIPSAQSQQDYVGKQFADVLAAKNQATYFFQLIALLIVIIVSLLNLSLHNEHSQLWIGLAGSALGIILPAPALATNKETQRPF
jgi:hypothetical protein